MAPRIWAAAFLWLGSAALLSCAGSTGHGAKHGPKDGRIGDKTLDDKKAPADDGKQANTGKDEGTPASPIPQSSTAVPAANSDETCRELWKKYRAAFHTGDSLGWKVVWTDMDTSESTESIQRDETTAADDDRVATSELEVNRLQFLNGCLHGEQVPLASRVSYDVASGKWGPTSGELVGSGKAHLKVLAGEFDTEWVKTVERRDNREVYETLYIARLRGRPIMIKELENGSQAVDGVIHSWRAEWELQEMVVK